MSVERHEVLRPPLCHTCIENVNDPTEPTPPALAMPVSAESFAFRPPLTDPAA